MLKYNFVYLLLFFLNPILWGSFYPVTKSIIDRVDPIALVFFDVSLLIPISVLILYVKRKNIDSHIFYQSIRTGSFLTLALLTTTVGLKFTTATNSGFLVALDGLFATLIAFFVLKQKVKIRTWIAGLMAIAGACIVIFQSPITGGNYIGDFLAIIGGIFYICFLFSAELDEKKQADVWVLMAIQFLVAAILIAIVAIFLADWENVKLIYPNDIYIILYIGIMTTFIPSAIAILFVSRVSALIVSFIYILEPIWGGMFSHIWLKEELTLYGYIGGGLIVLASLYKIILDKGEQASN